MAPEFCVCIDAYKDRDLVDPSCQAHDWEDAIKETILRFGISLKRMDIQDVYFIATVTHKKLKQVKIGVAKDVFARLAEFQTGNPTRLEIIAIVPGGGCNLEKELHRMFRRSKVLGEWFNWTVPMQEWIDKNAHKLAPTDKRVAPESVSRKERDNGRIKKGA